MEDFNPYLRVEKNDPRRCQSITGQGQCQLISLEGKVNCIMHSSKTEARLEKIRNYQLTKYQGRLDKLVDNDEIKSLREEIGILRMTLETIVNRCQDENDILVNSNRITMLVTSIEKVVSSCHRLENAAGELLDKTAVIGFAQQIITIINNYVVDTDLLEKISTDILKIVAKPKIE